MAPNANSLHRSHIIAFELLKSQPSGFTPSSRSDVPGYVAVLDNERARAWRLVLESGQSVAAITQQALGLRIVVNGGEIAEMVPGQTDRGMLLNSGEFAWQDAGHTRGIRNRGSSRIELLEFELK